MSKRNNPFFEVSIPVPFGEIAGKWYGSKDVRPILFIHGYTDNCGTFDRLIPHLPSLGSYLAIDLPGHGQSSRIPNGMMYHVADLAQVILWIMKAYKWSVVSLLGHSMGAMASYCFVGMFPRKVDLFIAVDALQLCHFEQILDQQALFISRSLQADEDNVKNVPSSTYTYDQMIDKIHNLPSCTIPKDHCGYILKRNIRKSTLLPESYSFQYDNRTKYPNLMGWSKEASALTAKRINFPVLIIKATDSLFYGDDDELNSIVNAIKDNNVPIKLIHISGGHYIHLIEAERVAAEICTFLKDVGYFEKSIRCKI